MAFHLEQRWGQFFSPKTYLNWLVAFRENIQQVCRRHKVKARESETLGLQILSQGFLAQWQSIRKIDNVRTLFQQYVYFFFFFYLGFTFAGLRNLHDVLWPNRRKMQIFFSANKVQSQTNRDWPTWLFPPFSRAASFCFKFWLVCYIICRHRDWQWSLNVTVLASQQQLEKHYIDKLTAHSRVEYNTHLSCKFSSFSYRPALLQQLTAFGICAASVINSYKNSEAQVTH